MYVGIKNLNIFNHKTPGTIMGAFSFILAAIMMASTTPSPVLLRNRLEMVFIRDPPCTPGGLHPPTTHRRRLLTQGSRRATSLTSPVRTTENNLIPTFGQQLHLLLSDVDNYTIAPNPRIPHYVRHWTPEPFQLNTALQEEFGPTHYPPLRPQNYTTPHHTTQPQHLLTHITHYQCYHIHLVRIISQAGREQDIHTLPLRGQLPQQPQMTTAKTKRTTKEPLTKRLSGGHDKFSAKTTTTRQLSPSGTTLATSKPPTEPDQIDHTLTSDTTYKAAEDDRHTSILITPAHRDSPVQVNQRDYPLPHPVQAQNPITTFIQEINNPGGRNGPEGASKTMDGQDTSNQDNPPPTHNQVDGTALTRQQAPHQEHTVTPNRVKQKTT